MHPRQSRAFAPCGFRQALTILLLFGWLRRPVLLRADLSVATPLLADELGSMA